MYKKLSLFLALILIIIVVAACGTPQAEADTDDPFESRYIRTVIDKETGCEYVVFDHILATGGAGGITPRLGSDGTPYCISTNKQQ